jgi:hypothetical protein
VLDFHPFADFFYASPTSSNSATSASERFASAFGRWLPDAASSSAMSLRMTLDAKSLGPSAAKITDGMKRSTV